MVRGHEHEQGRFQGIGCGCGDDHAGRVRRERIESPGTYARSSSSGRAYAYAATRPDANACAAGDTDPDTAAWDVQHRRISGLGRTDIDARADRL